MMVAHVKSKLSIASRGRNSIVDHRAARGSKLTIGEQRAHPAQGALQLHEATSRGARQRYVSSLMTASPPLVPLWLPLDRPRTPPK